MKKNAVEIILNSKLPELKNALINELKSTICVKTQLIDESQIEIGKSKIGGSPDLPSDFIWPVSESIPMAFLAQINLSETSCYDFDNLLPKNGILYFFFDYENYFEYYKPPSTSFWKVVYQEGTSNLERITMSAPDNIYQKWRYDACKLEFSNSLQIPPLESIYVREQGIDYDNLSGDDGWQKIRAFEDLEKELMEQFPLKSGYTYHHLLGHPYQIQGDCQTYAYLETMGLDNWDKKVIEENKDEIKKMKLLFQLDTDDSADMMWGDVGSLYFWIHERDLLNCNFDNVRMILQCT